jgi:hypothetical protein
LQNKRHKFSRNLNARLVESSRTTLVETILLVATNVEATTEGSHGIIEITETNVEAITEENYGIEITETNANSVEATTEETNAIIERIEITETNATNAEAIEENHGIRIVETMKDGRPIMNVF